MNKIKSLNDFKELVQASFDNNEESLSKFGRTEATQLKGYLVEANCKCGADLNCPAGHWELLEGAEGWYVNDGQDLGPDLSRQFFLDAQDKRVWKVYTMLRVNNADSYIENWIRKTRGLDNCWLTRRHLLQWEGKAGWKLRGVGIRFDDGLADSEHATSFSLKAWHGTTERIPDLFDLIADAQEKYAIHSVRWERRSGDGVAIVMEWYNNGKVTINRAADVDEVFAAVTQMSSRYADGLEAATELRDNKMAAFELGFGQQIDLDAFKQTVEQGRGSMRLWLLETESQHDFRRFRGVDLHTWDRILLDVGTDFAYLTVPGKGCVNAVPRLAALQGIDNAGKTSILFDGEEIFA